MSVYFGLKKLENVILRHKGMEWRDQRGRAYGDKLFWERESHESGLELAEAMTRKTIRDVDWGLAKSKTDTRLLKGQIAVSLKELRYRSGINSARKTECRETERKIAS